jgi:hypothetical protein
MAANTARPEQFTYYSHRLPLGVVSVLVFAPGLDVVTAAMLLQNNNKSEALCTSVAEQLLAFFSQKTADDGDGVIALLEDEPAGDKTSSPLIVLGAALAAVSGYVFLGNTVDNRANSRPHASTGAHRTRLVRGVEDEVRKVAAIATGYVFEGFQLYVFDARSRGFYSVTCTGNDHLALAREACNDRSNGIVASVTGAFGLRNSQLHKLLFRFVGRRNHLVRL